MPWQFLVVDGADAKSVFPLPEHGTVLIGHSRQDVDVFLNDLYVGRIHCQIEIAEGGTVTAKHLCGAGGSFVNKVKIDSQELAEGDILRVGNTHLRLERATTAGPAPKSARREETASVPVPPTGNGAPPSSLGNLQGHVLSHYEVGERLTQSAFRAIYLARDSKTDQQIILKVLGPPFPATPEELNRFVSVMRQVLPLRHENIVSLYGVGKNGPYTWIAREHVPGESLGDVLVRLAVAGRTRPKWHRGVRVALDIGAALHELHRRRLLHGHINPANILINTTNKHAKLANLLLDRALAGSRLHAEMDARRELGDVAYLSPEQCQPGAFVDELSDQYSLGANVYARLTGRPPFLGNTVQETLDQIQSAPLTRPRRLNPTIPEELDAVITKMLERRQEERFPSPAAFLSALEPFAAEAVAAATEVA